MLDMRSESIFLLNLSIHENEMESKKSKNVMDVLSPEDFEILLLKI